MPRKKPEVCLFCGVSPCECDGKPKKKTPTKRQAKPPLVSETSSDLDFGSIQRQSRFKGKEKAERDLPFMNALRSLRGIVSDRDKRWIDDQLNPLYPQDLDRRVSEWRAKHGNVARQEEAN